MDDSKEKIVWIVVVVKGKDEDNFEEFFLKDTVSLTKDLQEANHYQSEELMRAAGNAYISHVSFPDEVVRIRPGRLTIKYVE